MKISYRAHCLSRTKVFWALVASVVMPVVGCTAKPPVDYGQVPPEIQLEGVGLRLFRASELRAEGTARQVVFLHDTGAGTAHQVLLKMRRSSQEGGDVDLSVDLVKGDIRSREAYGSQGVQVKEMSGMVGTTESAHLMGQAKRVQGEAPVEIQGADYRLQAANGFFLNLLDPGSLELQGPVETIIGREK